MKIGQRLWIFYQWLIFECVSFFWFRLYKGTIFYKSSHCRPNAHSLPYILIDAKLKLSSTDAENFHWTCLRASNCACAHSRPYDPSIRQTGVLEWIKNGCPPALLCPWSLLIPWRLALEESAGTEFLSLSNQIVVFS